MRATLQIDQGNWPVASVLDQYLDVHGEIAEALPLHRASVLFSVGNDRIAVAGRIEQATSKSPGQTLVRFEPQDPSVWRAAKASAATGQLDGPALVRAGETRLVDHRTAEDARSWWKGIGWRIGPLVAFLALAMLVANLLVKRFFTVHINQAFVEIEKSVVSAPNTGRVLFVARKARFEAGEPIIGVAKRGGGELVVDSPCDCIVGERFVGEGSPVSRGDPILSLTTEGARRTVVVRVPVADLVRITWETQARIRFSDGVSTEVPARQGDLNELATPGLGTVELRLDPGRDIPPTLIGQPVDVTFSTLPPLPTSALQILWFLGGTP